MLKSKKTTIKNNKKSQNKTKQCGMYLQYLTFGIHTVILKVIKFPRKIFVRFRSANSNLKKRLSSFFLYSQHWFGAKMLGILKSVTILWYCARSEHVGVPFRRSDTEFAAMSPPDQIDLNTILCQEHSEYLRAQCLIPRQI